MPKVGDKEFPYTSKGIKAAAQESADKGIPISNGAERSAISYAGGGQTGFNQIGAQPMYKDGGKVEGKKRKKVKSKPPKDNRVKDYEDRFLTEQEKIGQRLLDQLTKGMVPEDRPRGKLPKPGRKLEEGGKVSPESPKEARQRKRRLKKEARQTVRAAKKEARQEKRTSVKKAKAKKQKATKLAAGKKHGIRESGVVHIDKEGYKRRPDAYGWDDDLIKPMAKEGRKEEKAAKKTKRKETREARKEKRRKIKDIKSQHKKWKKSI